MLDYELIRRKHYRDGQSARAIAKELGVSRKSVAKAIQNAAPPGYRQSNAPSPTQHASLGSASCRLPNEIRLVAQQALEETDLTK